MVMVPRGIVAMVFCFGQAEGSAANTTVVATDALSAFPYANEWKCGGYSTNMECEGFALGLCHSGHDPDCSNQKNCGRGTYAAIQCAADTTGFEKGNSHWIFGKYGKHLSCASTSGSAATGACGGGMNPDCNWRVKHMYFGIDCSDNNVKLDIRSCQWTYHDKGEYYSCPAERPILAGSCSGGEMPDCHGHHFAIQCCAESSHSIRVTGSWVATTRITYYGLELSYMTGTTLSHTMSSTVTVGASVSASLEAGCEILGVGGKFTVGGEISGELADMDEIAFTTETQETDKIPLPAGVVWQWVWDSTLSRGTARTRSMIFASTGGFDDPPCCLPGWSVNRSDPTGACKPGSPTLCSKQDVPPSPPVTTHTTSTTTVSPPSQTPSPQPFPGEEACRPCMTICAPCRECADGSDGSFLFGSCEKCWHCWNWDDDKLEDKDENMDKDCDALHKDHDWDDDVVRCLHNPVDFAWRLAGSDGRRRTSPSSKVLDCRACWAEPGEMSVFV